MKFISIYTAGGKGRRRLKNGSTGEIGEKCKVGKTHSARPCRSSVECTRAVCITRHENRIGKMPSFSYTVNGELNSFGAPVHGVVRLTHLPVRITLAHGLRPRQRFRTGRPDAVHATQREPPDAGALVSGHQSPVESANTARSYRWNGDDLARLLTTFRRCDLSSRDSGWKGKKKACSRKTLFPNLIFAIKLYVATEILLIMHISAKGSTGENKFRVRDLKVKREFFLPDIPHLKYVSWSASCMYASGLTLQDFTNSFE